MISLFIDTSTNRLVIGVYKDKKELYLENIEVHNDLSSKVLPHLQNILSDLNIDIKEIKEIYCVNGPGSFTGIRVGVTICKILALALSAKIYPVSSLSLMASSLDKDYGVALIDARRGYVYAGMYDNELNNVIPDQYIKLEDLNKLIKKDYKSSNVQYVSYDEIEIASTPSIDVEKLISKNISESINPHQLKPNYLKQTEAEEKLNDKKNN